MLVYMFFIKVRWGLIQLNRMLKLHFINKPVTTAFGWKAIHTWVSAAFLAKVSLLLFQLKHAVCSLKKPIISDHSCGWLSIDSISCLFDILYSFMSVLLSWLTVHITWGAGVCMACLLWMVIVKIPSESDACVSFCCVELIIFLCLMSVVLMCEIDPCRQHNIFTA